ncbi:ferritin-like domain-containing protein [Niabella ginsengisoli]|uniref:PA2169 family four-helix-bundle protein n=1 Tax=Niabella ginsengisoli TaxID=522298 RepID=A0ABS9SM97_9BACT|nr:PA2169 family four-helix-bundle protein [Niabella ginsengisoli]MCH5599411.1 PA2169 family four-helix-bundle protein [Niabella ginsengisoli]
MDTLNINKQVEILNDLVQINNDRIAGYEKALEGLNDEEGEDLKPLFQRMINNSVDYNEGLEKLIGLFNGEPALGTSGAGKLYRAWMDFKALVTGGDRKAILESCETGEETALRAYDEALAEEELNEESKKLILSQRADILQAHQEVQALKQVLK